jgi:lysophospholipase L1-like esterase
LILLCAAALTLGVGVVALELAFGQWLRDSHWSQLDRMNVVRDRQITYDVRHIYGPEAKPVRYTRDRHGLRSSCTSPARMQLVTLGGSTADQVYIDDEQTWQEVLRRDLNAALPGLRLCVANAGVDGHTTFGHIEALHHWLPKIPELRPRAVLLYLGINDAAMRLQKGAMDEADATGWVDGLKRAVKNNSALYRAALRLKPPAQDPPVFAAHRLIDASQLQYTSAATTDGIEELVVRNTAAFRTRLRTLLEQIERIGAKPVCVSQPSIIYKQVDRSWVGIPKVFTYEGKVYNGLDYRSSLLALNRVMAQDCPAAGGWYIDLESMPFFAGDFYDGVHMTPSGAARAGAYLASEFQRQGITALIATPEAR